MAKKDLLRDAKRASLVPESATEDDFTEADLRALLNPESEPAWEGSASDFQTPPSPDGYDPAADRADRLPPTKGS